MGDIETKNRDATEHVTAKKLKVNREEVVERAAALAGMSETDMASAMMALEAAIKDVAMEGKTLCLTGFGKFYLQRHKGHPVRYTDTEKPVEDYLVYKFSASNVWNAALREADRKQPIQIQ